MAVSEAGRQFSKPIRQVFSMLVVLCLVAGGSVLALPTIKPIFESNPYLNGVILGVFVVGVLACFGQVLSLMRSVSFIRRFIRGDADAANPPSLMAPFAQLLVNVGRGRAISASSSQTMLESVGARIEESRDFTRYVGNLLIFLGLLGTFYGLATTVPAVVDTIKSLQPQDGESGVNIFDRLMSGLEEQLGGMGTAFASSLLGLSGSLVVGLLELFATHGQNRFYRELEDWLSTITRISIAGGDGEGGADLSAFDAVFDQLTDALNQLADMQDKVAEGVAGLGAELRAAEAARQQSVGQIGELARAIEGFATATAAHTPAAASAPGPMAGWSPELIESQTQALERIAQGQERLVTALKPLTDLGAGDQRSEFQLRNISQQLLNLTEYMLAGRDQTMAELRPHLAAIQKALRELRGTGANAGAHPTSGPEKPGRKRV